MCCLAGCRSLSNNSHCQRSSVTRALTNGRAQHSALIALENRVVGVERVAHPFVIPIGRPRENFLVDVLGKDDLIRDDLVPADEHLEVNVRCAAPIPAGIDRAKDHRATVIRELRPPQECPARS